MFGDRPRPVATFPPSWNDICHIATYLKLSSLGVLQSLALVWCGVFTTVVVAGYLLDDGTYRSGGTILIEGGIDNILLEVLCCESERLSL